MKDVYTKMALDRLLVRDDLFRHKNIVIPVKTKGRSYGSISREARKHGWEIPCIDTLCGSELSRFTAHNVVFVALWSDHVDYSDFHIRNCVMSALITAGRSGLCDLAFPLLGGKNKTQYLSAMEVGVEKAEAQLDSIGLATPEVLFVTNGDVV